MTSIASVPQTARQLRACLVCSLVKHSDQFRREGCDNCESFLQLKFHPERLSECTTTSFDGLIANINPERSWTAKFKKIDQFVAGVYAVGVMGSIPEWVEDEMSRRGIHYIPRDGSYTTNNNSSQ
ncbi:hypothetical protein Glove_212g48 [Diversispora epigaea]|uniref:Transcription elongation factor SPT4 n=1 Tax=Diversispora epigaea TaxID=1348612 RepID=A0A397IR70_9GLOM|nr:hypothetical protein Glove_212g48 [Diversispora epigaea]